MSAGQVVGPFLAGLLLDLFGPRVAFAGVMTTFALAAVATLAVRVRGRSGVAPPPFRLQQGVGLLRRRALGMAVVTSSMGVWAMTAQSTFVPVHLESLSWSAATIGAVLSVRAVASVIVRPIMPQLVARLGGRERTVVFTLVALSASLIGVASVPTIWSVALWLAVFGAGHGLSQPISMVMVADAAEASERGSAMGVRMTFNRLSNVLAPVALAWAVVAVGIQGILIGHGLLVAGVAAAVIVWTRRAA
jgi:MFS family permease